jgi:hypothetical protein
MPSELSKIYGTHVDKHNWHDFYFQVFWLESYKNPPFPSGGEVVIKARQLTDAVAKFKNKYGDGNNGTWGSYEISRID